MLIDFVDIDKIVENRRLDPIYFGLDFFNRQAQFPFMPLKSFCIDFQSGFGAGKEDQSTEENGIVQIRPTNIDNEGMLKYDKNIFIPDSLDKALLDIDDVLFNNTNSQELVGKTAILKEKKKLFFSNHITRIKVNKEKILPDYLWIILNIYQQKNIFYSICTNWNNQSGVSIELLKSLKVPLPPLKIQQQIITLYNHAVERKQAKEQEAKALSASIDNYLLKELGIELPENTENERYFEVNIHDLIGTRLDVDFNSNSKYGYLYKSINSANYPVKRISEICTSIFQGVGKNETQDSCYTLLKVKNILLNNEIDYDDIEYIQSVPKFKLLKKNDIISPFIGEAIRQIKFSIFDNNGNYTVDNNTGVIRVMDNVNAIYVCEYLCSILGKIQINRLIGGGGVPFIGSNGTKKLVINMPPIKKQNEIAENIQSIRSKAKQLQKEAKEDLEKAKTEIEKIIMGE